MPHKRRGLGIVTLAVVISAVFIPVAASAVGRPAAGGALSPPVATPPSSAPAITARPTTASPLRVTLPVLTPPSGVRVQAPPPLAPGLDPLQASQYAVVVSWYDRSTDAQSFIVYRRDAQGEWQEVYQVPTHDVAGGGDYSWVDTGTAQSGQCYMIAAVGTYGAGYSSEECTVRPDPNRFPQVIPSATHQWYGLSRVNDGTGPLQTGTRDFSSFLEWGNETFGVNLKWTDNPSLWKVQAQGGPQIMYGQAVALRVWGGGWLKYGHQTWGVDLQLSSTPSYEWYILGEQPGNLVDNGGFALWDSAAHDYLVYGHQTFGVSVNWYQKTKTQTPQTLPPPRGVKLFITYNCTTEQRPLEMWVEDFTARTPFVDMGQLAPLWTEEDGCQPDTDQLWTFTPTPGHTYLLRSVDFSAPGCSNDPTEGQCWRSDTTLTGDANGVVVRTPIG